MINVKMLASGTLSPELRGGAAATCHHNGFRGFVVSAVRFLGALLVLTTLGAPARAQVIQGRISGTVTDESGAALPGATITLSSAALQVPQLVQVTDEAGEYQFLELPPGVYRVSYELSAFTTLIREDIRLTAGFAARLDVALKIATVAETVTVSGQSPLVDVSNTRGGTTVSSDILSTTPNSLAMQDVYLISGGVTANLPPTNGEGGVRALTAVFSPITCPISLPSRKWTCGRSATRRRCVALVMHRS
jgi:hypothetical protein